MPVSRVADPFIAFALSSNEGMLSPDVNDFTLERLSDGRIAVVYKGAAIGTHANSFYETIISANNASHTAPALIAAAPASGSLSNPRIAAGTDGKFMVGYDFESMGTTLDAFWRPVSSTGAVLAPGQQMSTDPAGIEAGQSLTALGNGNYLMAWTDTGSTLLTPVPQLEVRARILNSSGQAITGEFLVNASDRLSHGGGEARALADGQTLVFYEDARVFIGADGLPDFTTAGLSGRLLSATGTLGAAFSIDTLGAGKSYQDTQSVALGNGNFAVGWIEVNNIGSMGEAHFQIFNGAGVKIGAERVVSAPTAFGSAEALDIVGLASGGFAMHWTTPTAGIPQDHVRIFNMAGAQVGDELDLYAASAAVDPNTPSNGEGIKIVTDLELMANGHVLAAGKSWYETKLLTQEFDFGDERLLGTVSGDTLYGKTGVDDVIFGYAGNDKLLGFSGKDRINGGDGNDTIDGGEGNDTVNGAAGNDALTGGVGADIFMFNTALSTTANRDMILDFKHGQDKIALENAIFTAFGAATGVLSAAQFWASATGVAHDADDRILYNTTTGVLTYDGNGTIAGGAVQFAVLKPGLTLSSADFVIV